MRRIATALLLAAPLAASAQVLVPVPPPPPPPPVRIAPYPRPPPPPVYVAPAPPLSPFYFNLGIGGGVQGGWDAWGAWSTGGLAYSVEAGGRLAPQLLVGFDLVGLSTFGNAWTGTPSTTLLDYDLVLTVFPFVRGFFLRGGGGLSTLTVTPPYAPGVTSVGSNVLLGAGWAFPVALPLHLTIGADWTWNFFSVDVGTSYTWSMRAGIGFY
jgi:hypothetical protein